MRSVDIKEAAAILQGGGLIVYQTETFFAIGALVSSRAANAAICAIKGRPAGSPLPVIAGSLEQADSVARLSAAPQSLLAAFWPGPLSVILPAREGVAPALLSAASEICIRVTSSASAANLALAADMPLSASSANLSGQEPAPAESGLSASFLEACANASVPVAMLAAGSAQVRGQRAPSTIVRPVWDGPQCRLEILRPGAVPSGSLAARNWN